MIGSSSKIRTSSSSGISSCQIRKSWDGIDGHLWMAKNANVATALGFSPAPILDLSPMCTGVQARDWSGATGAVSAKPSERHILFLLNGRHWPQKRGTTI